MDQENQKTSTPPRTTKCGCGRSPHGYCIGWHNLSEDDFRQQLAEYEANLHKPIE
jgi:hypothetical protein